jgi:hypothetical protein
VKNLFRKTTVLFMTLCLIVGMTGLPMAAYAEGLDDAAIVAADKDALVIGFGSGDSAEGATGNLILVTTGASGSGIAWLSDTPEIIANDGAVTRPAAAAEDAEVTLTATITYGEAEDTKAFTVTVPKESEPQMLFGMMSVTWVGDGTEGNPYQVSSADHLAWITANSRTAHYIQTANIDLAAAGFTNWTPIGGFNQFTGTYNGNGYSISNLFINSTRDQVGLFGYIGSGGMLENIKLENVTVFSSTSGAYVGALVGTNMGSVYNCSVSGSVSGGNSTYVGGLIGNHSGAVSNCSSAGNINGGNSASIGGLIGNGDGAVTYNYSTAFVTGGDNANVGGLLGRTYVTSISDNYSTGTVTGGGNANVGGLVGEIDDGDVSSSYSTGSVNGGTDAKLGGLVGYGNGVANGCYYLNTAAATSAGGAPLTDAQMKKQASFANWDFGGAWFVAEAQSYPVLAWQVSFSGGRWLGRRALSG